MDLKIKVKEFKEEHRELTEIEKLLFDCWYRWQWTRLLEITAIENYFKEIGFQWRIYRGEKAIFRREKIRDATPEEKTAYLVQNLLADKENKTVSVCTCVGETPIQSSAMEIPTENYVEIVTYAGDIFKCTKRYTLKDTRRILAGKEIILELEEK